MKKQTNNKAKQKSHGEVFTPISLVNDMLDKFPQSVFKDNRTFLDNSCGTGNFLIEVLNRKMANGFTHEEALKAIYGSELDQSNVDECKKRLSLDDDDEAIWDILNINIICADALDPNHIGWNEVGYYWSKLPLNK